MRYTRDGWPDKLPMDQLDLQPFFCRRNELSLEGDVLLWGMRVIIPKQFRAEILDELHTAYRSSENEGCRTFIYVWWPGMDADIESCTKACESCQLVQRNPTNAPVHPWISSSRPGEHRLCRSRGRENASHCCRLLFQMTSEATVNALRTIFSRVGIPHNLVSDNGPQFKSQEFKDFLD